MAGKSLRLALIQLAVGAIKRENLLRASKKIEEAAGQNAQIICLPECFNSPYGTQYFAEYAEDLQGESCQILQSAAAKHKAYVVGGSIPERDGDKLFNTCTVWSPAGEMVTKHRKVHLFDIDVPGGIKFKESETLSPGSELTMFRVGDVKVGLGICYDIRFPEMAHIYAREGCKLLIYPGAFNMTTGPVHWELLQRARALDNQLYVAAVSPARDEEASYVAWGHSTVVNPWGQVVATTDESEAIIYADLDFSYLEQVRQMIPLTNQRRNDIYSVVHSGSM